MARCNACGAEIRFIRTEKGRQMPVEPKPITVITSLGKTIQAFVPHWTTCPGASQHRQKSSPFGEIEDENVQRWRNAPLLVAQANQPVSRLWDGF
jgi:hypothetical protein